MPVPPRHVRRVAAVLVGVPLVALGVAVGASSAACTRDAPLDEAPPDATAPAPAPSEPAHAAATTQRVLDASASAPDARVLQRLVAAADAGRYCGSKDLPDCPLQLWMKQNATTMLEFGEITTLAEVFDKIALVAPPSTGAGYQFPFWVSISRDGAAATRTGNLEAAKAACRGCHTQYLTPYHSFYRGLPLPAGFQGAPQ